MMRPLCLTSLRRTQSIRERPLRVHELLQLVAISQRVVKSITNQLVQEFSHDRIV